MSDPTIQRFVIQWRDLDANGHMRNTAYLEYATQARFAFFATHGFPLSAFRQLSLGPITLRDEITYVREVHMLETIESRLHAANWSDDGVALPAGQRHRQSRRRPGRPGRRRSRMDEHGDTRDHRPHLQNSFSWSGISVIRRCAGAGEAARSQR